MKKALLILMCLIISGCASFGAHRKEITRLNETITLKNIEIENLIKEIKEKDARIEKLKDKLKSFGAFE